MKVILKKDIGNMGRFGDVKEVSNGYARNYLIPRGFVSEYSKKSVQQIENEKKHREAIQSKIKQEKEKIAKKIAETSITICVKTGEEDRIFGSVTSSDVASELKTQGISVDKKDISIPEEIRTLGVYTVAIHLYKEVNANLKVWVVKE